MTTVLAGSRKERDHDVQCDDVSALVSVAEFKRMCAELYEDVCMSAHVTQGTDHVTSDPHGVAETCNTETLLPPGGLDPYLKGKKAGIIKNTKLQCLNHIDVQRAYFEQKGLTAHGVATNVLTNPSTITRAPPPVSCGGGGGGGGGGSSGQAMASRGEVVVAVYAYHPIKKRCDTKILLLGCQPLTTLRDKIPCFRDFIIDKDYSEDPDTFDHHSLITRERPNLSESAFFFINNTFYNDGRHPKSMDLSAPIIEWVRETDIDKSPRLDHFSSADMASTRVDQLQLRLGYPYLYCHHQTCQHIVIFSDLRLLHPTASQKISDYPKSFLVHFGKRRLCLVCNIFSPLWVTLEDELAPESPSLFCNDCFKKLHYSSDGRKLCHFKAYPYNPTMLV